MKFWTQRELVQMAPTFVFLEGGGGRPQLEGVREQEQEDERGREREEGRVGAQQV